MEMLHNEVRGCVCVCACRGSDDDIGATARDAGLSLSVFLLLE